MQFMFDRYIEDMERFIPPFPVATRSGQQELLANKKERWRWRFFLQRERIQVPARVRGRGAQGGPRGRPSAGTDFSDWYQLEWRICIGIGNGKLYYEKTYAIRWKTQIGIADSSWSARRYLHNLIVLSSSFCRRIFKGISSEKIICKLFPRPLVSAPLR